MAVSTKRRAEPRRNYIIRHETHGEFTKGAPVKVSGERGRWTFLYYCVNTDTGSEWVDVFGGENGTETLRAFKEDRITLIRPKGYRRPRAPKPSISLEDLL